MALVVSLYACIRILEFKYMLYKSDVLTLEPCSIFWLGYVVVSINAGAQVAIFTHYNCI